MSEEMFKKYEELAQEEWPKDLSLWKNLFLGNIGLINENLAKNLPYRGMIRVSSF